MAAAKDVAADEDTRGEYIEELEEEDDMESNVDADEEEDEAQVTGLHEDHAMVMNRDPSVDYSVNMKENEKYDDDGDDDDDEQKDLHNVITKAGRRKRRRNMRFSHEVKMLLRHASRCVISKNPSSSSTSSPPSTSSPFSYISASTSSPASSSTTVMMHRRRHRPHIINRTGTNLDSDPILTSCSTTVVNDNDADDLHHRSTISVEMEPPTIASDAADEHDYINDIMGLRRSSILLQRLRSLQSIIPPDSMHTFGDIDSHPCVIRDALGYLQVLRNEIKSLKGSMTKSMLQEYSDLNDLDAEVEVEIDQEERLNIRVSCRKTSGSLVDLMSMLESVGLIFDHVNVSSHAELLLLNASINITI